MGDPVLVIMAKQPAVGRTKTRLCPPLTPAEAAALYEALLRDTIGLVASLKGVRLAIAVTPPEAIGDFRRISPTDAILLPVAGADIGECLDQVLGHLLAAGHSTANFQRAIALNSDGPTLPVAYLRQAIARLEGADVVLGPSEDGGYYLIGLTQPRPELFRGIEWSTERVTAQTLARAEAMGLSVALLPPWYDVDTAADLDRLRAELAALPAEVLPHTRRFFNRTGALRDSYGWRRPSRPVLSVVEVSEATYRGQIELTENVMMEEYHDCVRRTAGHERDTADQL
jgi:rSAM/selenodomain-associated transferase 1